MRCLWLVRLVEKHLLPRAEGTPAVRCDMCDQHKQSVRGRTVITVGPKSGTVRREFCDEYAATVTKRSQAKEISSSSHI